MTDARPPLSYHALQTGRKVCSRRWGSFQDLPIVESAYRRCRELYAELGGPVLDVGAGVDKPLQHVLGIAPPEYASLDDDPDGVFDYRRAEDLPAGRAFRLIVANQFFEHLSIEQTFSILARLAAGLAPGGKLLITVPNIAHPNRFWAVTHVTPWDFMSLCALLELSGLRCVEIARYNKVPGPQTDEERRLAALMARLYRMDWCDSILVVGETPVEAWHG